MAETIGEAREGGARERGEDQVKFEGETETETHMQATNYPEGKNVGIEMRTARDAKAVPSSSSRVGVGGLEPLEHHLNRDQLANLTLESTRIKVMHTNSIPKLVIIPERSQFLEFFHKRNATNAK